MALPRWKVLKTFQRINFKSGGLNNKTAQASPERKGGSDFILDFRFLLLRDLLFY